MKRFAVISTICLIIIAGILMYNRYAKYRQAKEAEVALANMEADKPERYKAQIPLNGSRGADSPDELVISVDDEGRLKVNSQEAGTTSDTSQLRTKLEQYFRERGDRYPDRAVFIKTSRKLPYAEIKKVIDAARSAGADPVGLRDAELK